MIRNYLKNFEKYSILISSLLIILGIFLLVSPMKSLEVAVIFFAAIMMVNGISSFISYSIHTVEQKVTTIDYII